MQVGRKGWLVVRANRRATVTHIAEEVNAVNAQRVRTVLAGKGDQHNIRRRVMPWIAVYFCYCFALAFFSTSVHGDVQQHSDYDEQKNLMKALSDMNNDFAFRLYRSIGSVSQSENVFFSPLSVSMTLAALSLGAGGETHEQLLSGLGFSDSFLTSEEMHDAYLDLLRNLSQRTGVDLNVGTAVYVNETFRPHMEFLEKIAHFYLSEGFSVDFTKTKKTSNQMNKYVSEKTHGKIRKVIKDLDSCTLMYLLSYVYFKGKWAIPFDPQNTIKAKFSVDAETSVTVQMMNEINHFHIYSDHELSTTVLRLDYNDSFSMILALPKDLAALQEALLPHHIENWTGNINKSKYEIHLPKLSLKTSYSLNNILTGLGMKDMFTDKANFAGITDENIYISEAMHKATLDVDEVGATATAVTKIRFAARTKPISLKFNKPFMIFIIDQETKSILFMGKIVNPANSNIHE